MNDMNHESTITVNAFNLEDLHVNMLAQIERLENVIAVASLASGSDNAKQLKGAISVMRDTLIDAVAILENDHESMTHLIKEAQTTPKIGA